MTTAKELFEFRPISCPVCGSKESRKLGFRGGEAHQAALGVKTSIVRCLSCTHQYPDPMPFPKASLEEIYGEAADYFQNHEIEEKKANGRKIIAGFEKRLGRKGDFLDVGCGRGEMLWAAKHAGWNYVGIDPSSDFIEFGRTNLGVEGRVGTLPEMGFESESFDAIAMSGIVEHLYEPAEILSEIHHILRPDGWLYLDAPNEDGLYMTIGNLYMKARGKDWVVVLAPTFSPYHVQGFNPISLKRLLENTGFEVKEFDIFGKISPQTGDRTMRKSVEYAAAKCVNAVGNAIGQGMYMDVWAQKAAK